MTAQPITRFLSTFSRARRLARASTVAGLLLFLAAAPAAARWPTSGGGVQDDAARKVITAPSGNVFVAGTYRGVATFDGTELTSQGSDDVFVLKYDSTGNLLWAASAGGGSLDSLGSIIVDDAENVYVVGSFHGTIYFGSSGFGGVGAVSLTAADAYSDAYVAKLGSDGMWGWARRMGGALVDEGFAVGVHPGNDSAYPPVPASVFVSGRYTSGLTFFAADDENTDITGLDNTVTDPSVTSYDLFVARIDTDGNWLWAIDRDNGAAGNESADQLLVAADGTVLVAGRGLSGTVTEIRNENFEGSGPLDDWTYYSSSGIGVGVSTQTYNSYNHSMYLRGSYGYAWPDTPTPLNGYSGAFLKMWIRSGHNNFSDEPDSGENLVVRFWDGYQWNTLETLKGGGSGGIVYEREYALPQNALTYWFYPSVLMTTSNWTTGDYWHVDDIIVEAAPARYFIARLRGTLAADPVSAPPKWDWYHDTDTDGRLRIEDMSFHPSGDLAIAATSLGATTLMQGTSSGSSATGPYLSGSGAVVARVALSGYGLDWTNGWARKASTGVGSGVAVDDDGNLYLTGSYGSTIGFNDISFSPVGGNDVFVAKVQVTNDDGSAIDTANIRFVWASSAGGDGDDQGFGLSTSGEMINVQDEGGATKRQVSDLQVVGSFEGTATFGVDETLTAVGGSDAFVANMIGAQWFEVEGWVAGEEVPPPPGAFVSHPTAIPEFYINGELVDAVNQGLFLWVQDGVSGHPGKLIALQPVQEVEIYWHVSDDPLVTDRIPKVGGIMWPAQACRMPGSPTLDGECYQVHVAGAPVELEPVVGGYKFLTLINPAADSSGGAVDENNIFRAPSAGYSVVIYEDELNGGVATEVVRSYAYQTAPEFVDDVDWVVGSVINDASHEELGRAGYVLNRLAFYDPGIYDRDARTGTIIPVNRVSAFRARDAGKNMVVSWYRVNQKNVYWPTKPVRYTCRWPVDPDKIVVASELGSDVLGQDPMDPLVFQSKILYNQSDVSSAGYNPNDEHAFFAPSNAGTGFESLFALRSDFGSGLHGADPAAASDPYVLLKYRDADSQQWRFKVYQVLATGAGYDSFRYTGLAATTVSPPYPVRLLPNCAETTVVGERSGDPQPPAPFFRDYSSQLWAKSAGDGAIKFHYPLQPTFFYDVDNDDAMDEADGQCVPWLARLPEDEGGSPNLEDPILVFFSIAWPENVPLLQVGETLLQQKRGLPNIYNQEAVRVVFDELYESNLEQQVYDPYGRLVRLIDPLSYRRLTFDEGDPPTDEDLQTCYGLDDLPTDIAFEYDEQGRKVILGSLDGTKKLPYVLRSRMRFDNINDQLIFYGSFDDSGAGEPLLLLNVMTLSERDLLQSISANQDWDTCVDKLYNFSRNPLELDLSRPDSCVVNCVEFSFFGINFQVCLPEQCGIPDGEVDQELLIGLQDSNSDGVPEAVEGLGTHRALTAGFAQGTGFVTLAFNDHASLSPLPVSLNVIRVGCLRYPEDVEPPELLSSYMGEIKVIEPDNVFDEALTLRHSGDFAGNSDALEFEWYFHPDEDGTPPTPLPDPDGGQMHGWQRYPVDNPYGANQITIRGANIQTLSDNWYVTRYRGLPACGNDTEWSVWAGQPGSTPLEPRAQLAEGWVKRVVRGLNPFEARVKAFHSAPTNNFASMLVQLGERYEGDIAFSSSAENLNQIGLIEAYETVMRRAMNLSVNSTPPVNYGPANAAILNVASRITDFYTFLGNEAYSDAQDPMIGISTTDPVFGLGALAPTIFNFENQLASLLEEELVLLRGRDDSQGPVAARPVYNRLFWNFTSGNGEIAYALSYNIYDAYLDGVIDEKDAKVLYPQGHGDAWGHYLTAITTYYDLLRHPFFTWEPRPEAVLVAGVPIQVDYFDERKFAKVAAAKAKAGAEIVDLTYRSRFVEDPAGQWQGYKDNDSERAWGLSEWGRRAGVGGYLDWVTANSVLPAEDPDPTHVGIQRLDRANVKELDEISANVQAIQAKMDNADRGLNPLGLAKGVVPFDIDPAQVDEGMTHFEQIYQRASDALDNTVAVWDFANQINKLLRFNQDTIEEMTVNSRGTERSFKHDLVAIFGYPYVGDDLYPDGYDGPDLYHYMFTDSPALEGTPFDIDFDPDNDQVGPVQPVQVISAVYNPMPSGVGFFDLVEEDDVGLDCGSSPFSDGCSLGDPEEQTLDVEYRVWESLNSGLSFPKPANWGQRRATGKLQDALAEILQAEVALDKALTAYNNHALDVRDLVDTMKVTYNVREEQIDIKNEERHELNRLTAGIQTAKTASIIARRTADGVKQTFDATEECVPDSLIVGLSGGGDVFAAIECTVSAAKLGASFWIDIIGDAADIAANITEAAQQDVPLQAAIEVQVQDARLELFNLKGQLDHLIREEPVVRAEVFAKAEELQQSNRKYLQVLAEGQRALAALIAFRRDGAAAVQEHRYQDMAFRIFRNDALAKYRASFDMAARYAYLAATAYDYDTNLLGTDAEAGQNFLTDIVRERSIGQVFQGAPVAGSRGLADPLGRMLQNFAVLKGQMGFNNPQTETNRFSLRSELFRITGELDSDEQWRGVLREHAVEDLWMVPEFRRYCRPFAPESSGPQPGLVIPFSTTVTFGLNFFGWPLGPGDSAYDPTHFATRVRGVGAWFEGYEELPLSNTPRVYLVPVGADVLRSPSADDFRTREWTVVDQVLPVPFPIGSGDLEEPEWTPLADMLSGPFGEIRRFSSFRAYHFSEPFSDDEIISDSRLIGRSVWNTRWLLIVPGGTLLYDADDGLNTFIDGELVPGGNGERDGEGVSDIKIFYQTYAYSGN